MVFCLVAVGGCEFEFEYLCYVFLTYVEFSSAQQWKNTLFIEHNQKKNNI